MKSIGCLAAVHVVLNLLGCFVHDIPVIEGMRRWIMLPLVMLTPSQGAMLGFWTTLAGKRASWRGLGAVVGTLAYVWCVDARGSGHGRRPVVLAAGVLYTGWPAGPSTKRAAKSESVVADITRVAAVWETAGECLLISMKYAALFLTLGPALVIEAVACRGLYWLLVWPGISLTLVGLAYLRLGPGVFGKTADGTMAWYSFVPLLPYLLAAWAVWHVARFLGREDCYNLAAHGLFVGRRPRSHERPSEVSLVVDLAAEFIECRAVRTGRRYLSVPMLDTGILDDDAFLALVREVADWPGVVYIHCAQGHGRTGTLAAAVLLAKGHCDNVDAAIARLRGARPRLALGKAQLQFVRRIGGQILPVQKSAGTPPAADSAAGGPTVRDVRQALADTGGCEMKLGTLQQTVGLILAILICFAAAGIGSLATTPQIPGWYANLAKPTWTPPGWIFGPVWTLLYLMMAVAAWLVWRPAGFAGTKLPLALFAIQLALNSLWSVLFFGLHRPGAAAVEIILLWAAILATMVTFWRRSRVAGGLLAPYLAWVSFATVLNLAIWRMNA